MDVKQKLEQIEYVYATETLTKKEKQTLEVLCIDTDAEVRLNACEALQLFPYTQTESLFLKMLNDTDVLVQCEACAALALGSSEHTWNTLLHTALNNKGLLRGYAAASLADVQKNMGGNTDKTTTFLKKLLCNEDDDWVRIIIYRSLIVLGIDSYKSVFWEYRRDSDYRNRYLLLNLLEEMLDEGLWEMTESLHEGLQEMLINESAWSVKEKLQQLLLNILNSGD